MDIMEFPRLLIFQSILNAGDFWDSEDFRLRISDFLENHVGYNLYHIKS